MAIAVTTNKGSNTTVVDTVLLRYPAGKWSEMITQARALRAQGQQVALNVSSVLADKLESYCTTYGISRVLEEGSDAALNAKSGQR